MHLNPLMVAMTLVGAEKYRVYFTEYKAGHHVDIFRWDWGIGAGSGASTPAASNGGDEYLLC